MTTTETVREVTLAEVQAVLPTLDPQRKNPGKRGDNIGTKSNPGCVYTAPDGRHCIAGEVLTLLDVPVPQWGDPRGGSRVHAIDKFWLPERGVRLEDDVVLLLGALQEEADSGRSWGESIDRVRRDHPRLLP
jgi:hypothetical protein